MPRKKLNERENEFDYLEKKYGVTPLQILHAIEKLGPYKARLETYFQVEAFVKGKVNQELKVNS
jgi:hypothetical protein